MCSGKLWTGVVLYPSVASHVCDLYFFWIPFTPSHPLCISFGSADVLSLLQQYQILCTSHILAQSGSEGL